MTQEQLRTLLITRPRGDKWIAMIPEMNSMWAYGETEQAAIDQWAKEYDDPYLHPIFASCLQDRVAASKRLGPTTITEVK